MRVGRRHFLAFALAAASGVCAVRARGRPRVAVVGGGFAGAACALHLRSLMPGLEVTLIDPAERYVTCPMSNEVLVGWRSLSSITVTRTGLARHGVSFIRDEVAGIDLRERRVRLRGGAPVAYDRLVVAPGIRFLWGQPEGYTETAAASLPHAWQAGAQTELLASQLKAMRPGGVVAISVPAGPMRCPPGPFERASLIAGFLQRNNPRAKVLIFDANNHFPRQDVFMSAWQELYPGLIEWIPVVHGGAVVRVAPAEKVLYTADGAHRADVINIIPPQAPARLCAEAGLASDHGWCPIAADGFESTLAANVHVIGDACIADPMPKSASAAAAQALCCAGAIASALGGRDAPAAAIESVCYSLLAPDRALAIRARFEFINGEIHQLPTAASSTVTGAEAANAAAATLNPRDEVREAAEWYRRILADSFGAGYHPTDS